MTYILADESGASALITTVGTLLGVLVGGLLTAGLDEYGRNRNEKRLRRAAGRLLGEEFDQTAKELRSVADTRLVTAATLPDRIASWDTYREILATRLDSDEWVAIATAVGVARASVGSLGALITASVPIGQLSASMQAEARGVAAELDAAASTLRN